LVDDSEGKEPAFYHAGPYELDSEVTHSWPAAAHIDLTAGTGNRALLCCKKRLPYLGFCLSTTHAEQLLLWLESAVFKCMQTEGDDLYQPALAELLVAEPAAPRDDDDDAEGSNGEASGPEENSAEEPEEEEDDQEEPEEKTDDEATAKPGRGRGRGRHKYSLNITVTHC
jgi:hypothetical protein